MFMCLKVFPKSRARDRSRAGRAPVGAPPRHQAHLVPVLEREGGVVGRVRAREKRVVAPDTSRAEKNATPNKKRERRRRRDGRDDDEGDEKKNRFFFFFVFVASPVRGGSRGVRVGRVFFGLGAARVGLAAASERDDVVGVGVDARRRRSLLS